MFTENILLGILGIGVGITIFMAIVKILRTLLVWLMSTVTIISLFLVVLAVFYFISFLPPSETETSITPIVEETHVEKTEPDISVIDDKLLDKTMEESVLYQEIPSQNIITEIHEIYDNYSNDNKQLIDDNKDESGYYEYIGRENNVEKTQKQTQAYPKNNLLITNCEEQQSLAGYFYLAEFFCGKESNAINRVENLKKNGFRYAQYISTPCFNTDVNKDLLAVLITPPYASFEEVLTIQKELLKTTDFPYKTLRPIFLGAKQITNNKRP